jgi:hypothetical protein
LDGHLLGHNRSKSGGGVLVQVVVDFVIAGILVFYIQ